MLVARNKDKLEATAADVRSVGAEAKVYDLDLREPQAAEIVIKGTLERFGRIDALLNIAGAVPLCRRLMRSRWRTRSGITVSSAV